MGVTYDIETLTKRQLENEERIIDGGITKYRDAQSKAEAKGQFADTMTGRWLTSLFIDPIVKEITTFVQDSVSGKPGVKALGAPILNRLKYDSCAFITLRSIQNGVVTAEGSCEQDYIRGLIIHELKEEMTYNYMEDEKTQTYKYGGVP